MQHIEPLSHQLGSEYLFFCLYVLFGLGLIIIRNR